MKDQLTRLEAIQALVSDAMSNYKLTRANYLRCVRACDALGLTSEERITLLSDGWGFNYIDRETRELRERYRIKKKVRP